MDFRCGIIMLNLLNVEEKVYYFVVLYYIFFVFGVMFFSFFCVFFVEFDEVVV